jgi:hypothetical protein
MTIIAVGLLVGFAIFVLGILYEKSQAQEYEKIQAQEMYWRGVVERQREKELRDSPL